MKKRFWYRVDDKDTTLKRIVSQTLIGYIFFVLVLIPIVYVWERDFIYTFLRLSIAAPIIFIVLSIPIFLLLWIYMTSETNLFGKAAAIWILGTKAYIPVLAEPKKGVFFEISPIFISNLKKEDLISAIEKTIEIGHPQEPKSISDFSNNELLVTAGVESYSSFDVGFIVRWTSKEVLLDVIESDSKSARIQREFDANISLEKIVDVILNEFL